MLGGEKKKNGKFWPVTQKARRAKRAHATSVIRRPGGKRKKNFKGLGDQIRTSRPCPIKCPQPEERMGKTHIPRLLHTGRG